MGDPVSGLGRLLSHGVPGSLSALPDGFCRFGGGAPNLLRHGLQVLPGLLDHSLDLLRDRFCCVLHLPRSLRLDTAGQTTDQGTKSDGDQRLITPSLTLSTWLSSAQVRSMSRRIGPLVIVAVAGCNEASCAPAVI